MLELGIGNRLEGRSPQRPRTREEGNGNDLESTRRHGFAPGDAGDMATQTMASAIVGAVFGGILFGFALMNRTRHSWSAKGVGQGTGLGLATVYGIAKQNNGLINVYSEPGKDTTFGIYLPRLEGEADGLADAATSAARPGGNGTILLVEDEKSIRATAALFFEAFGYTVPAADCPEEAHILWQR